MKLNYKPATILSAALLAASFAMPSQAAPVCVDISAKVTAVNDSNGILGRAVRIGDVVTGSYTYDSATPNSGPLPSVGDYQHSNASHGIILKIGKLVFRTNPDNVDFLVEVINDHGNPALDALVLRSYNNLFDVGSNTENHIYWSIEDTTLRALSGITLPTTAPDLSAFNSSFGLSIRTGFDPAEFFQIDAKVNSASLCVVPGKKVTICHHASPKKRQTMIVPHAAVAGHLAHGDKLHACTR